MVSLISFKLVSYNMLGFRTGQMVLDTLVLNNQIIALQEHYNRLLNDNLSTMYDYNANY